MDGSENHPKPANRAYLDQSHVMRICLIQQQTDWNDSLRFVAIFFFRIANLKFSYLSSINGDAAWFEELNNWLSVCAPRMTMAISLCLLSRSLTERQTDMPILHVPSIGGKLALCTRIDSSDCKFPFCRKSRLRAVDEGPAGIQACKLIPFPHL